MYYEIMFIITLLDNYFPPGSGGYRSGQHQSEWSLVFSRDLISSAKAKQSHGRRNNSKGMISQLLADGRGAMCVLLSGINVFSPQPPTAAHFINDILDTVPEGSKGREIWLLSARQ